MFNELTDSPLVTAPDQYTTIPFRVKAMKILLKELEQSTEPLDPATAEFEEAEDVSRYRKTCP